MKYKDLEEYTEKPTVCNAGVKWLYILDYYDVPLLGVVEFDGVKYYADIMGGWGDNKIWYAMVELTQEQINELDYWHNEFIKHVKTEGGDRSLFYEPYQKIINQAMTITMCLVSFTLRIQ